MIGESHYTDGVTTDSVSEFMFADIDALRASYCDNKLGYQDAVFKMLIAIGMSGNILLPRSRMRTGLSEKLRADFRRFNILNEIDPGVFPSNTALNGWLAVKWPLIINAIDTNYDLRNAIVGFLRREFRNAFLHTVPNYDPAHYFPLPDPPMQTDGLPLQTPEPLRTWLSRRVEDLASMSPDFQENELQAWIDSAAITHYRNFRRAWEAVPYDYTPCFTRTEAGLLETSSRKTATQIISIQRCIAVEIIRKVKRRADLIDTALSWRESSQAKSVMEGYQLLRLMLAQTNEDERNRLLEEVNISLNTKLSAAFRIPFEVVALVKKVATGELPNENGVLGCTPALRWLWKIRHPSALVEFTKCIDALVEHG